MIKRAQNRIAESRWALPVTAAYALLVCLAAGLVTKELWMQLLMLVISTLMMVDLNNANALIRIYSRMVSCSFVVMTLMATFLSTSLETGILQISFIAFFLLILRAYQDQQAAGWVFYAFCAIGVASIVFVKILYFVPVLWILLSTNILAASFRSYCASFLGIIIPYWFVGAYDLYNGKLPVLGQHFAKLIQFGPVFDLTAIDAHRMVCFLFVLLLTVISSAHFLIYSYKDKIRTRMIYEMFIVIDTCCFIFILLQPQHFDELLTLSIVVTSPLSGHFLSLSNSRLSNITFFAIIILALLITIYNL